MAAAFVQARVLDDTEGSGNFGVLDFNSNVTAGNLIIAGFVWSADADEELTDVDDNLGNTYVQIGSSLRSSTDSMFSLYYAKNITGGACTVTGTMPGVRFFRRVLLAEYSGLDTTAPLDKWDDTENGSIVSGTDGVVTPAVVPANNGQMIVAALMIDGGSGTIAAGTGYNERADLGTTSPGLQLEDFEQTTAASITGKWTLSASGGQYNAFIATFQVPQANAQVLPPSADSVDGSWTDHTGGTSLAAQIDETTASDSDFIQSELSPNNSACRVKLTAGGDPAVSTGHEINWRISKNSAGGQTVGMVVKLYQGGGNSVGGGSLIAEFTRSNVSETWTSFAETLSGGQADSITDYADLYLEFWADV